MTPSDAMASGRLQIDLSALRANIGLFQGMAGPSCIVAGVVKADAYGLGIGPVSAAMRESGVQQFFVATPDEGVALRALLPGDERIAVLGGLFPNAAGAYRAARLTPVLNTLEQAAAWRADGGGAPCMLHIDTGMNRLGLDSRDRQKIIDDPALLAGLDLQLVMSHFACADELDHPMTAQQFSAFRSIADAACPGKPWSIANSSGIFRDASYHGAMVRPGMAVYGLNPVPERPNPMRPVVALQVPVLQIRDVAAGDGVGYGAAYRTPGPKRVATVALGYADGFLRSLSGRGVLFAGGAACPILGRVSMDLVTIDADAVPSLRPGDWVDVLGPGNNGGQDADALAESAGTIGYEILTGLGARYRRIYTGTGNKL